MRDSLQDRRRLIPIALAQLVGLACGVVGVRLMSHWVEPAAFGVYGVFLTFTTVGAWIVYSGLTKFVGRAWATANQHAITSAIAGAWRRKLGWMVAGAVVGMIAIGRSGAIAYVAAFAAIFVSAALLSIAGLAQAALQAARFNWQDLATSAVGSITRTFVPPLL